MNKKISTSKKDDSEEPLIDQSIEVLKKLILKEYFLLLSISKLDLSEKTIKK